MKALTCEKEAKILLNHLGGLELRNDIILSDEAKVVLRNYKAKINNCDPQTFINQKTIKNSTLDVETMQEFIDLNGVGDCDEYQIPTQLYTSITDEATALLAEQDCSIICDYYEETIYLNDKLIMSNKAKDILSKWDGKINYLVSKEWVESLKD